MSATPDEAAWSGADDAVVRALATDGTPAPAPQLRVVRGEPDEVELAALVAGIAARTAVAPGDAAGRHPRWTDRASVLGLAPAPGPGAWRWSARR